MGVILGWLARPWFEWLVGRAIPAVCERWGHFPPTPAAERLSEVQAALRDCREENAQLPRC